MPVVDTGLLNVAFQAVFVANSFDARNFTLFYVVSNLVPVTVAATAFRLQAKSLD